MKAVKDARRAKVNLYRPRLLAYQEPRLWRAGYLQKSSLGGYIGSQRIGIFPMSEEIQKAKDNRRTKVELTSSKRGGVLA
jgi:hypothetical protein